VQDFHIAEWRLPAHFAQPRCEKTNSNPDGSDCGSQERSFVASLEAKADAVPVDRMAAVMALDASIQE
jgi:hypothetical protein